MVCSRAVPDVPPPLQLHEPPLLGCGPNITLSPEFTVTLDVCCQVPLLTCKYGVIVVGVQLPEVGAAHVYVGHHPNAAWPHDDVG